MAPANSRRTEVSHTGVPYTMATALILLAIGSIVAGYAFSEALFGWGTPFWAASVLNAPGSMQAVSSHMIPVALSYLPLLTVPIGFILAFCFLWPLPYCADKGLRTLYLFLQARWHFDFVWNQQV
jgi:hypothetical protein